MRQKQTFIEIGASNFDTLLPLARSGWRGVVVEPIPFYAAKLREVVEDERLDVRVVEAAITTHNGQTQMYECLERDQQWTRGISHLVNQTGTKLLELAANKHLKRKLITVTAYRLDTLLWDLLSLQHLERPIDFMKIDVEGHELDILKNYTWNLRPTMLKVEHKHCDDQQMRKILENHGYMVWTEQDDLYAIR